MLGIFWVFWHIGYSHRIEMVFSSCYRVKHVCVVKLEFCMTIPVAMLV